MFILFQMTSLKGKVAIVTGGSRGIGREVCLALAREGCNVVVAAKTTEPKKNLPGTIYTVAQEVSALGVEGIGIKLDLQSTEDIESCVKQTFDRFGRIDILVNNASALWWQDIVDTPMKKFDLINSINSRGTFAITKACLPYMENNAFGRIVMMSPPVSLKGYAGHTAYNMSKFGMTMVALGVSQEYQGKNICANSLWPATVIESYASINFKLGDKKLWRKASIIADATLHIIKESDGFSGNMLIDDEYLRSKGYSDADFIKYRCDPDFEPPRLLAKPLGNEITRNAARRGDVKVLEKDMSRSTNFKSHL